MHPPTHTRTHIFALKNRNEWKIEMKMYKGLNNDNNPLQREFSLSTFSIPQTNDDAEPVITMIMLIIIEGELKLTD